MAERTLAEIHSFTINGTMLAFYPDSLHVMELDAAAWEALQHEGAQALFDAHPEMKGHEPDSTGSGTPSVLELVLLVAGDCNLMCDYCCADHGRYAHARMVMSTETARKSVEHFIRTKRNEIDNGCEKINIAFYGGEPLLNFSLIREMVDFIESKPELRTTRKHFHVTTNGLLLDTRVCDYLNEHNFSLEISIDGPARIHDAHRCFPNGSGSFSLIMESLTRLREYPIHRRTALRAVLSEDGHAFFPQYEFLKSLAPMGFRAFSIEPDLLVSGLSEKLRGDGFYSLRESFRAAAEDYRQSLSEKMFFRFENLSVGIERLQKRCKKTSRCSPGRDRISVDPEGMLLACPTGLGAPQNVMGNINEGYDPECQILWDASGPLSAKKLCADCWAAPLCGGNCRALSLRKGNGMNEPEPVYCLFTKMCLEYAMWLMSTVEPRTMETMLHGYRNECEVGHANAL